MGRSPPIAQKLRLLLVILFLITAIRADESSTRLVYKTPKEFRIYECLAAGECEECAAEEISDPDCQATGQRQQLKCSFVKALSLDAVPTWSATEVIETKDPEALLPSWRSCENAGAEIFKFFLFEVFNVVLLFGAATIILWRRRIIMSASYQRIAARLAS
ncbi:hypothetical protein HDU86_004873 [Geranomyces michiganensis]|nr:hypothetical protein HDU86_004873 [Geranomyces michiganensis]